MTRFYCLLICCLLLVSQPALAQDDAFIPTTPARLKTTFETLSLPGGEKMGLLGGSFLFKTTDSLSLGGSSYGALTGNRGGFITLGLAAELQKQLPGSTEVNAGMFIGAGGGRGGNALQGGGLMLRYHLGGQYNTRKFGSLGAGLSYVDFPNGHIESLQPYLSYAYPFTTLFSTGWFSEPPQPSRADDAVTIVNQEFAVVYQVYDIPSDVHKDNGNLQHQRLNLMGVEWDRYLNDNLFLKLGSAGAMGGESNGYMQLQLGAGARLPITASTALKLSTTAGYAGGGGVATGGGLLLDASLALQQDLWRSWFSEVSAGYVFAPDGEFKATSLSGKLGYRFRTPGVEGDKTLLSSLSRFSPQNMRIRLVHQSYIKAASDWRKRNADENVNLLGFQLDSFLNKYFYLTGQGIAAYQGQAGGYMTGLVGIGATHPLFNSPLSLEVEGLMGAAGGGGLDVAGGLVWQANAGLDYKLSKACSVMGSYGYMAAPRGAFRAKVIGLSLNYKFSFFTLSH
ncbi:hypothetical protein [Geopsychrobacter electrodiphilus]|uniref:hypothetical protein n=1 Tax=Geopsychrobacter electrodiphilus TaxID=225196 RepID=UPI000377738A|nr:hypothetical protein [Geopsychrobacter electrodiphilus]